MLSWLVTASVWCCSR